MTRDGELFVRSFFVGDLDMSWSSDDFAYDLPHGRDARERVVREIALRRGQSAFRQGLLHRYGARCVVTGSSAEQVLEAAHIDPYKGTHTNKPENGLLLRADIHTLFDLFLLTFSDDLTVHVSPDVESGEYRALDGQRCAVPPGSRPSADRLRRHRLRCTWLEQPAAAS